MKLFELNFFPKSGGVHRAANLERVEQFNKTMDIANKIALQNPDALRDLVRALLRPLQSEHILSVAERGDHEALGEIDGYSFFFDSMKIFDGSKYLLRDAPKYQINLARDPVLPTNWRRDGFVNALANIGTGKKCGTWTQSSNHSISLWLPWEIGFVLGGNHSISSGILSGENIQVVAREVIDFGPVLDQIECDGANYKDKQTGKVLAEVSDSRRAAVFEIGRLMKKHKLMASGC